MILKKWKALKINLTNNKFKKNKLNQLKFKIKIKL
jgi:hypothetical protein